jgi:hypothetical protein
MFKNFIAYAHAFTLGMVEFRTDFTTSFEDDDQLDWYDTGRDLAHRLTFRHWDY